MRIFLALVIAILPSCALAQTLVATHADWRLLTAEQSGKTLCYLASLPVKKEGNYSKRGEPFVLVTHISGNQDEVSVSAGYAFKEGVDVALQFDQTRHVLFAKDDLAWARDAASDRAIVKAMLQGSEMVLRGTSWKGTYSKDTYSLSGFIEAHRAMKALCGH